MSSGVFSVDLSTTIGALQIGSLFAVFLFGIVTLQAYLYYDTFRKDSWTFKALVAMVWILEGGHTSAVSYEVYHASITLYGKPYLLVAFPALGGATAISGFITMVVQTFFALRLFRVLPKPYKYIGVFCFLVSFTRAIGSIYLSFYAARARSVEQYHRDWHWLVTSLLVGGASIDVIITISMVSYLVTKRSEGLLRTSSVLDSLIGFTIRTGLLTSITAIAQVACFLTMPHNLIYLAVYTFQAKLYSNSLYSALNSRQALREKIMNPGSSTDPFPTGMKTPHGGDGLNHSAIKFGPHPISIEMNSKTTTTTISDEGMGKSLPEKYGMSSSSYSHQADHRV